MSDESIGLINMNDPNNIPIYLGNSLLGVYKLDTINSKDYNIDKNKNQFYIDDFLYPNGTMRDFYGDIGYSNRNRRHYSLDNLIDCSCRIYRCRPIYYRYPPKFLFNKEYRIEEAFWNYDCNIKRGGVANVLASYRLNLVLSIIEKYEKLGG